MLFESPRRRRAARVFASAGAVGSAVMLVITGWSMAARAAATNAGNATVTNPENGLPSSGGGSNTNFGIKLPTDAACTGDTATGGYNVQSYMVPSSVDPASLTYDSSGPTPQNTGSNFRQPFYDTKSNPYAGATTANATAANGPGPIVNIPTFTFSVYGPADVPAGTYNIGIACTKGQPGPSQLDKYWTAQMTITTDSSDTGPAKIHWVPVAAPATGSSSSTTPSSTTSTTRSGSTNTTAASSSTTVTTGSSDSTTSTTDASGGTTTTIDPSSTTSSTLFTATTSGTSGTSGTSRVSGTELGRTGGHPWRLLIFGGLFLYFGRLVLVLSRPMRLRRSAR